VSELSVVSFLDLSWLFIIWSRLLVLCVVSPHFHPSEGIDSITFFFSYSYHIIYNNKTKLNSLYKSSKILQAQSFFQEKIGLGTHLFVNKVPRAGDSEVTFWSSSQAATSYYQSNHSKVEAILLSALPGKL